MSSDIGQWNSLHAGKCVTSWHLLNQIIYKLAYLVIVETLTYSMSRYLQNCPQKQSDKTLKRFKWESGFVLAFTKNCITLKKWQFVTDIWNSNSKTALIFYLCQISHLYSPRQTTHRHVCAYHLYLLVRTVRTCCSAQPRYNRGYFLCILQCRSWGVYVPFDISSALYVLIIPLRHTSSSQWPVVDPSSRLTKSGHRMSITCI